MGPIWPGLLAAALLAFAAPAAPAPADDDFASVVDKLIASVNDPRQPPLRGIDDEVVVGLSRDLGRLGLTDERTRLFRAFAQSPRFSQLSPRVRSLTAIWVLRADAATLSEKDAVVLLRAVREPKRFVEFLAMRDYAAIWPLVETQVGPGMSLLLQGQVNDARDGLSPRRADDRARSDLALARYRAGEFDEAVQLAAEIDHRPSRVKRLTEDQAWTLNTEAYALDGLGRRSEGDAIFELLADIPLRASTPWIINFRINRALRLVGYGEWGSGLKAAAAAEALVPSGSVAIMGRTLLAGARVCALAGLGRASEAAADLRFLDANRQSQPKPAVQGFLCAGDDDRAAALAIESLQDPGRRDEMVALLQGPAFELFYPPAPALPEIRRALRYRPDVADAFDRVARDIPAVFAPRPGLAATGQGEGTSSSGR
ncbi:MAG: hypothetical protein JNM50_09240 [Chromatiales bacterium]|jgi:tetratricopeptide (TPR) repeat protein|nr:hypothetical protein [Chromatiales bacterium]